MREWFIFPFSLCLTVETNFVFTSAVESEAMINLRPGAISPMNATINYQRFASSIAMSTASPPATRVSPCGMFIYHRDLTLSVVKWRSGSRTLADELLVLMDDLCLHEDFGLSIPDTTYDDWGNDTRGYSWTKNGTFLTDNRSLLAAMLAKPELKLAKLDTQGQIKFDTASIWDFLNKCDVVNEKLALLAFFTAGQTPRVSEFIEHKYANSTRPRTMFREHKSIWLATRRVKNESQRQKETFLPIKCHPELTSLLERYLLIVRPVEAELVRLIHGEKQYHVYKEYLWTTAGRRLKPEEMRKAILKFNTNYCDVTAGTKDYREMCVQMGRTFLGSEFEIKEDDLDALAAQAGHTITMSRLRYAPEVGKPASMSSDLLLRFGRVSEMWWEHAGFKPGCPPLLPLRVRREIRDASGAAQVHPAAGPVVPPVIDTQAIILAITSKVVSELQRMQINIDSGVRRAVAEAIIEAQYPDMGGRIPLPPAPPPPPVSHDVPMDEDADVPPPLDPLQDEMTDIYGDPEPLDQPPRHVFPSMIHDPLSQSTHEPISEATLDALLRLHFPDIPNPSFKSPQQKAAVRLALEHRHSFVAVLPTGGGKSLTFTLPAFNPKEEGYHTYIAVPSRALLEDQVDKARKLGISTKWWSAQNKTIDLERLIFAAMESMVSKTFKEYVVFCLTSIIGPDTLGFRHWALNGDYALRWVLDEAHLLLSDSGFRPQFKLLREHANFYVQRIFLTATLAKRLEQRFLAEACMPPTTKIIRAPCNQPHISYIKLTYNIMNTNDKRLAIDVANILNNIMGDDRIGIIFCSSRQEADQFGNRFTHGCVSHSQLPEGTKTRNEAEWKGGQKRWIAATTGLTLGVDSPVVGAVIFMGVTYGMNFLYQGAGRSGRDGRPSWVVVLQPEDTSLVLIPRQLDGDPECLVEAQLWLQATECRRLGFTRLYDEDEVSCNDLPGAHFCDFCGPKSDLLLSLQAKIIDPPKPVPTKPMADNDDYDTFGIDDLLNVDFDGVPELGSVPSTIVSNPARSSLSNTSASHIPSLSATPVSDMSMALSDPLRDAPAPGRPSMQVQQNVAYHKSTQAALETRQHILNTMTTMLLGKCPLCWAYRGVLEPKHNQRLWIHCRGPEERGFIKHMGAVWKFKKLITLPKYQSCWKCHLPQANLSPPSHPDLESGDRGNKPCPHEDLVVLVFGFIRYNEAWWDRARLHFGLASNIGEAEIARWYARESVPGGFINGVVLMLWFYLEKEKERHGL